jgi:hypothetical protein
MKPTTPRFKTAAHYPPELQERIARHSTEAATVEAAREANDARLVELRDVASLTSAGASDRLKAIAKARAERLATLASERALHARALAILADMQTANNAETARLADLMRGRERELRERMAALGITEELACRRASIADAGLNQIRGDAAQVGQGHRQVTDLFKDLLRRVEGEIAAALTA